MADNDLKAETTSIDTAADCSKQSIAGPAGLCIPGDPTVDCKDVTNPANRTAASGISKSKASNSATGK